MATSLFPEENWLPWKFQKIPAHFWTFRRGAKSNQSEFLRWVAQSEQALDSTQSTSPPLDWFFNLTKALLSKYPGGSYLLQRHRNSVQHLLRTVFPNHTWHPWRFARPERNMSAASRKSFEKWLSTRISQPPGLSPSTAAAFFLLFDTTRHPTNSLYSVAARAVKSAFPELNSSSHLKQTALALYLANSLSNVSGTVPSD